MSRAIKTTLVVLAAIAACWLIYLTAWKLYFRERGELSADIRAVSLRLGDFQKARTDHKRLTGQIQSYVNRTLGGDLETVDHRLRSRLNRLAEQVQLQQTSVGTSGVPKPRESPARNEFTNSPLQRPLRDEVDFVELEGWISGSGTFEQALNLIDSIEAEPWLKRIDQLTLDPADNGAKFTVDVRLTTLFVPKGVPDESAAAAAASATVDAAARRARRQAMAQLNPFRVPPPAPDPPPAAAAAAPPSPAPFPYEQWALTGIAQSATGHEAWLLNRQTKQSLRLLIGERLHEAVLLSADGEAAEFLIGNQRFRVAIGQNLHDRSPVNQ